MRDNLFYLLLLIFSIGTLSTVSASPWNVTIYAVNQLEPVTFGYHPNATDDYDEEFDEYTQLPLIGKVIMELDDIYAISIKRDNLIWNLSVGVPLGTTTTLSWNTSNVPGNIVLTLSNETVNIDMKVQKSLNLSEGAYWFIISATPKAGKPNLNITDVSIGTPLYRINTPINVTITNNGHLDTNKSFSVNLYADANKIGSITVDGLKIGESKTLTFNWTPEKIKEYTLVMVVDAENVVSEENEDDNKIVETVEVIEKPIGMKVCPPTLTTNVDSTFTVNISLYDVDHRRPVMGVEGILTYDPQVLTCTNFTFLVNATMGLEEITFEMGRSVNLVQ